MKSRLALIASIVAVVAMCVLIFAMSAQDADESTELSMGVVWHIIGFIVPGYDQMSAADQLHWQQMLDHPVRKTAHFLEYAVLGALTLNMLVQIARQRAGEGEGPAAVPTPAAPALRQLALAAWALATAYAVSDEIHQVFVPGRAFMFTDILIDSAGILFGVFLLFLVFKRTLARSRDHHG